LESRSIDRGRYRLDSDGSIRSLTAGEIVGRKGGNHAGIVIPTSIRAPISFANTDYAGITLTSNTILPAISDPDRSTSAHPGDSNMLYIVPGINPRLLQHLSIPIVVTEGEFKRKMTSAVHRQPSTKGVTSPFRLVRPGDGAAVVGDDRYLRWRG
jgi:hypothetical protein